jgi:hypothetical protein
MIENYRKNSRATVPLKRNDLEIRELFFFCPNKEKEIPDPDVVLATPLLLIKGKAENVPCFSPG